MDEIETFLSTKCIGKKNAVKSSVLESMFQLKGSEVRKIINRIRCNGQPICSGSTGYYYASTEADIRKTIRNLNGRIDKINAAKNRLQNSIRTKKENQHV